jgi:fumarate reductase subunit D
VNVFFDSTGILSLMLLLAAVATLFDVIKGRKQIFDERLTADDRNRIVRLVIFLLLPLSIILHELGHAIAIWSFGGEVIDWGFYLYYGYVVGWGVFTDLQSAVISFSGPVVNVILALGALAIAWFWPRRHAVNYLLFIFAAFELFNALVFYPLFDFAGGVAGDFSSMYSRDTPVFSLIVGAVHVAILIGAVMFWRSPTFRAGYEERTGRRRTRTVTGAERWQLADIMAEAATDATQGWKHEVQVSGDAQAGGTQMVMRWQSRGFHRALLVHATHRDDPKQHVEIHAAVHPIEAGPAPYQRPLMRIDGEPDVDELALYIRRALDFVETWDGSSIISPS